MRWKPILVTWVCIIIRCRPIGIITLNVRLGSWNAKHNIGLKRI
ncbi:hypothetical protein MTR67_019308 [Solanum verrucosum]|uniref:Uncharacterized protein n=1 Tax=Solanum verrucosum TaxID=315347 RepID=A0AAF0QPB8_SOLVR|nr:hypothetical protein MTR67_019308 [Solanum verrucosum]